MTVVESDALITGAARRRSPSLRDVAREFWRHPSPWIITALLVGATVARLVVGDWVWTDALVVGVIVAAFPFYEWLIHVFLLHWRPKRIGRLTLDPAVARKHRLHHADPRNIPLVFIPWRVLARIVPVDIAIALFAFPRVGLGLTFLVMIAGTGLAYEWSHYLIHTDYRPVSRPYRAIWRHHRLHHYKNEHYWFGVSTSGVSDRVLRTAPDPAQTATSPTVRDLHAREAG
jgi:hypothetical protein